MPSTMVRGMHRTTMAHFLTLDRTGKDPFAELGAGGDVLV